MDARVLWVAMTMPQEMQREKGREGQREPEIRKGGMCERVGFTPEHWRTRQMDSAHSHAQTHTHHRFLVWSVQIKCVCLCAERKVMVEDFFSQASEVLHGI